MTDRVSTSRMARPGRDVSIAIASAPALDVIEHALSGLDFSARKEVKGGVQWNRGRTGLGIVIDAAVEIAPLWLLPGSRKHVDPYGIRARVLAEDATTCTLRLDMDRRAGSSFNDGHFATALRRVHEALVAAGANPAWGELSDSAREPQHP